MQTYVRKKQTVAKKEFTMERVVVLHPLMKHVHRLSVQIGPRGTGTAEEKTAAEWITKQFRAMGLKASVHEFRTVGSFSYVQLVFFGGMLAAFWLGFAVPWVGFALSIALLIFYILDVETRFSFAPYFARRTSQNIRAWSETADGFSAKSEVETVVITAHYDSSRAALNFHPKMVKNFRQSFFFVFASLVAITFFLLLRSLPGLQHLNGWFVGLSVPFVIYLFAVVALLLHREIFCQYTPGANDNASGVAVMLGLASRLKKQPIPGLRVEFVATGAEEAGTFGCLELIRTSGIENKLFINLDNLGSGNLFAAAAEGILGRYHADAQTLAQLEQVKDRDPSLPVKIREYRLLTTDATPILARGGRAVSIMACAEDGSLPNWHWVTDTATHVEAQNLRLAEEWVYRFLEEKGRVVHQQEEAAQIAR